MRVDIMQADFEQDIEKRKKYRLRYNQISNIIGGIKVCLSLIILATLYALWEYHFAIKWIGAAVMEMIVFAAASVFHDRYMEKVNHEEGLIAIDEKNIKRRDGQWHDFVDTGEEYIDYDHDYAMDLDIVGSKSIFQFLNSTHTCYGRSMFSADLLKPRYSEREIKERQEAAAELSCRYDFASEMEYRFSRIGVDAGFFGLMGELKKKEHFLKHEWMKYILYISRFFTLASVIYGLLAAAENRWTAAAVMLSVQIILCIFGGKQINGYIGILYRAVCKIDAYNPVIEWISEQEFTSDKMKSIQEQAAQSGQAVRRLSRIFENISQCHNGIMKMILDALFLWSYKNAMDLDAWKQEYGDSIEECFMVLGELESLLSFANLPRVCEGVCLPEFTERENFIRAEKLGHPLIGNGKRVCNDITLERQIFIISGSNMSGKTTFMRTVGVNLILAFAGSFVCAGQMTFSKMQVVTSMRIVDDLKEETSTFYAELKRIKKIIDRAGREKRTLFFIDEIFRGTNSVDRLKGAEGVLKELWKCGAAGMITTHDLEICQLASEQKDPVRTGEKRDSGAAPEADRYSNIVNYSFCETYNGDEIYFDYCLKKGKSTTTNGEYLLKQIGILKDFV